MENGSSCRDVNSRRNVSFISDLLFSFVSHWFLHPWVLGLGRSRNIAPGLDGWGREGLKYQIDPHMGVLSDPCWGRLHGGTYIGIDPIRPPQRRSEPGLRMVETGKSTGAQNG